MFSLKYLIIVAKIRVVVVAHGDGAGGEVGDFERIAISPFPNLLYTVFRSSNASPLPDIFSTMFFFRYCRWMTALKDGGDLDTSRPQLHGLHLQAKKFKP